MLPEQMVENLSAAWDYGKNHQMAVAVLGLFTCLLAMFLAGRIRWVCSSVPTQEKLHWQFCLDSVRHGAAPEWQT